MEALGLIGGLAGAAINSSWQGANLALALENLRWQKRQGDKQFRLSSAGRTDAYGNKQRYNEYTNEWELELSPTQKKIVTAGEAEQLRTLTEDAFRARRIKERQAKRGDMAAEEYLDKKGEYLYRGPEDEKTIRGQLQGLLQGASNEKTQKSVTELGRDAIRQGRGAMLGQILKAGWDDTNAAWSENLLKARTMGLQESMQRSQAHESKYLPVLKQLQETMDMGGENVAKYSDVPNRMAAEQGQQSQLMLQALQNAAGNVNSAQGQVTKAASDGGIDLKGLAGMIGAFGGSGKRMAGGQTDTFSDKQYKQMLESTGSF